MAPARGRPYPGMTLGEELLAALGPFVANQPWFVPGGGGPGTLAEVGEHRVTVAAGAGAARARKGEAARPIGLAELPPARIARSELLRSEEPALLWLAVELGEETYQLLVGIRSEPRLAELRMRETSVLGPVEGPWGEGVAYDALCDSDLTLALLQIATGGAESASRARRVGIEKSNSCIVYDDRLLLKIFRRLSPGRNPEALLAVTLDEVGFNHVATPVAVWQEGPYDSALVREFLVGGTDGWSLALTSLRDLFARGGSPEAAGGDFAPDSRRLGEMTAKLHVALAQAFGPEEGDPSEWARSVAATLRAVSVDSHPRATRLIAELPAVADPGSSVPVHGDYHLGRVMRTEVGWYVMDLEGDPAQDLEERHKRLSPLKDVAAMLRSFQYATVAAVRERGPAERAEVTGLAALWRDRNRRAFLDSYLASPDISSVVPSDPGSFERILDAFEMEKAARELAFELSYRPWRADAIRDALNDLLNR